MTSSILKSMWFCVMLMIGMAYAPSAMSLTTDEITGLSIKVNGITPAQSIGLPENYQCDVTVDILTADGPTWEAYEYCSRNDLEITVSNPEILEYEVRTYDYGWMLSLSTKSAGTASVTFKIKDTSISSHVDFKVDKIVESSELRINNIQASSLVAGNEVTVTVSRTPYWSTDSLKWSSSQAEIMQLIPESVTKNSAKFALLKTGDCDITVTSAENPEISATKTFTVDPTPALKSIQIGSPEYGAELGKNLVYRFRAIGSPAIFTDRLTWSCSDESVIKLTPEDDGRSVLVTALELGKSRLTVTSADNPGISSSIDVSVVESGIRIMTDLPSEMYAGDVIEDIYVLYTPYAEPVEPRVIEATSSDPSVLEISRSRIENGVRHYYSLRALAPGTAEITFTDLATGVRQTIAITVKARELDGLTIRGANEIFTELENTFAYTATPLPAGVYTDLVWSIDRSDIATLSDTTGDRIYIYASAPGTLLLTATSVDNPAIYATKEITVSESILQLPSEQKLTLEEGGYVMSITTNIRAYLDPEIHPLEIASTDTDVVKAGCFGGEIGYILLEPTDTGHAVVSVSLPGTGLSASMEVTVVSGSSVGVDSCFTDKENRFDIYDLQGHVIMSGASPDALRHLAPGLYLINGKVYCIRH